MAPRHRSKAAQQSNSKSPEKSGGTKKTIISEYSTVTVVTSIFVGACLSALVYFVGWKHGIQPSIISLATVKETVATFSPVTCSTDYEKEFSKFPDCVPKQCGRAVRDSVVSLDEATSLLKIGQKGLAFGGSSGGASILDLHSGALSQGDKFVDIYSLMRKNDQQIFTTEDFTLYSELKNKIHSAICEQFNIPKDKLFLTHPTFFSRMTDKPAKTVHDEYWHNHIDKETYGTFDYTSLLYLSSYGHDFNGGRFIFVDKDSNTTVEPKLGRVSFFTSGSENVHHVEKVSQGTRYAITVSFTCDPQHAIKDPRLK